MIIRLDCIENRDEDDTRDNIVLNMDEALYKAGELTSRLERVPDIFYIDPFLDTKRKRDKFLKGCK